jgi:hypothetical protein
MYVCMYATGLSETKSIEQTFMEPQDPATCPYPEPPESSLQSHSYCTS